jgi:hypothetical protein
MPNPVPPPNPPGTHGNKGLIAISTTATGTVAPLVLIAEWTLDMARDLVETTALGDSNKTYVAGLKDLKGTFTGFWDALDDSIFEAADSPDGIKMEIYPSITNAGCWKGPAWLDVSVKGGVSSAVSIDGTFSANGAWTRTPQGTPTGLMAEGQAVPPTVAGQMPGQPVR